MMTFYAERDLSAACQRTSLRYSFMFGPNEVTIKLRRDEKELADYSSVCYHDMSLMK